MQYAQLWHAIVSFGMTAVIFAHIYLGSVGMEGAYDAMGKGEVEEQWAREHHSIWAEKAIAERDGRAAGRRPVRPMPPPRRRSDTMKTMLIAFAAALVIAVVADVGLNNAGFTSAERQTAPHVRLD